MVLRAVLMKSGLLSINTAKQVNVAHTKATVNAARPMSYLSKKAHSTVKRHIHKNRSFKNSNFNQKVNTVKDKNVNTVRPKAVVNAVMGNNVNVVKASACWVWKLKTKVLDHVSKHNSASITLKKHMTENMPYLIDYEEIDGGYVAFGGNPKGGKITRIGKGTIKTVLSLNFKLIDESQVLLRVPRKNNMYSVDLKNIVPKRGLTCPFAKATSDESKLWHRRLATKDETSGILKSFITGIENLVDHKVKVIRCDNGTEFKNREINKFCEKKVNTACYVQNRVLVVKPRNKTPYELFHGRTPTLSFMRPFGCPVTILNTIDHLGKFDGKANEGFIVGYSLNSKAFRVFNSRTKIVEENLHIRFSESTPNVVGSGPDWLFDIDALTRTMNYEPIVAGTQSNGFAGTKASNNAGQARKETEPVKDYILLPLWTADPPYSQDPKNSHDDGSKPSSDDGKKVDEDPRKDSEFNAVGGKTSIELPFDPNMPALEDYNLFDLSRDDEDHGAEADMNNLNTTIQVSPIPTTRIHKDHPLDQVIKDLQSATQTRRMLNNLEEHGFVSSIQQRTNHKGLQNCLFACFLS
ncbi:uncharacterized mitochondrial protein-like protein [Tanacetum coccineum]